MPPIATTVLNTEAIDLVRSWITNDLASFSSFADWQRTFFGSASDPAAAPDRDPDHDGANNYLEYLTERNPLDPADPWKIGVQRTDSGLMIQFPQSANRLFEVQSATNSIKPIWQALDVPDNLPLPSVTNRAGSVIDPGTNAPLKLYRVEVREP